MAKDGFSAARLCIVVSGRMCSSWSRMVRPSWSFTGTTERAKRPSAQERAARFWLSTE